MSSDKTKTNDEETTTEAYEPPVVEDLDTMHGPAATPAGVVRSGAPAAPRELS